MKLFKLIYETEVLEQNGYFHILLRLADGWYKYPDSFLSFCNANNKAHSLYCWSWVDVNSLTKVEY